MPAGYQTYLNTWANAAPASDPSDIGPVTLGNRIQFNTPGRIVGVRYYRDGSDHGSHVGMILDNASLELERITLFKLHATGAAGGVGWEHAYFRKTLRLASGDKKCVAVFFPNGNYWRTLDALTNPIVVGNLTVPSDSFAEPNGMYNYEFGLVVHSNFRSSRYGVDVLYLPD